MPPRHRLLRLHGDFRRGEWLPLCGSVRVHRPLGFRRLLRFRGCIHRGGGLGASSALRFRGGFGLYCQSPRGLGVNRCRRLRRGFWLSFGVRSPGRLLRGGLCPYQGLEVIARQARALLLRRSCRCDVDLALRFGTCRRRGCSLGLVRGGRRGWNNPIRSSPAALGEGPADRREEPPSPRRPRSRESSSARTPFGCPEQTGEKCYGQ